MAQILQFMPKLVHTQLMVTLPVPTADCTGKTIIVTGANVGLGKEASRHFLQLNAEKVILACRSLEKGEEAKKDIEKSTSRTGAVEVWQLDLGNYDSVKRFAERAKTLQRVDAVVENAGIMTQEFKSVEGNESQITVNVIATLLLALLLLPTLQESARKFNITPTVTIVTSMLHMMTAFPERKSSSIFESMNDPQKARMSDRYNVSKLLEIFAVREIAREHPTDQLKVTFNTVNPGYCSSGLMRDMPSNPGVRAFEKLMARTTEEGSRTLVHAATRGPETHGKYLNDCKIAKCGALVECGEGAEIQKRVWDELAGILESIQPGILGKLDG